MQFREQFNCGGCEKMNGKIFRGECDVYNCAKNQELKHCGMCIGFPCEQLKSFIENGHNTDRMSNLLKWKNENEI